LKPPAIPDDVNWPANDADRTDGVLLRRAVAYLLDLAFVGCLWFVAAVVLAGASLVTFGLLSGGFALLVALPIAYHVLTIALQGATWGQHLLGLVVRDRTLAPATLLQALVSTVLFYLTVPPTGGLVLLAVFFLPGRRTLHDVLAGTVVLRRRKGPVR